MATISKKYINELFQKRTFVESLKIHDSNRIDDKSKQYDVFLSYCYSDKDWALKFLNLFESLGYRVYIDLRDKKLDRSNVDRTTAERIADIMNRCKSLVYIHTAKSTISKWCPWELGYMSGKKNFRCATILLVEDKEDFPRQEYLEIYPYLTFAKIKNTDKFDFWAHELDSEKYVKFKYYIDGENPYLH